MAKTIRINRAPVLTLWAAVVAERLGFHWDEALTLGKALAVTTALGAGEMGPPSLRRPLRFCKLSQM